MIQIIQNQDTRQT